MTTQFSYGIIIISQNSVEVKKSISPFSFVFTKKNKNQLSDEEVAEENGHEIFSAENTRKNQRRIDFKAISKGA